MRLCDWCGEAVPEDDNEFLNLRPEHWPYSKCKNKQVKLQLHDECCSALVGILREGGERQRPAPLEQKQSAIRGIFR